ncbi:hypothetical protein POM88_000809 [Heracleum sosnowskyi]|uniref:Uncharacterized protein n=1 Tax=Heracleum sosnowskyi TaxID=360622 RepID=A0AAD8JCW1_9APIA|nr:hypothetical protein POM88_000809 [Heracleum sosnowskyi]
MITRYALNCIFNDTINLLGKREMEIDVNALVWFHPHDANMKDASINDLFTVKGHCRVLVLQYLLEEIIKAGKEISEEKWLDIVESLFWQATKLVELSNSSKGNLACVDYAKVKCIATTNPTKGGQLLVVDTSYFDILWNLRKAELMVIEVYNLPNVMCKSSEVVKNIFYLGAELDSHDWTLNYVIVHAQSVEVIQILNAYKYRVSRQGSAKMDK